MCVTRDPSLGGEPRRAVPLPGPVRRRQAGPSGAGLRLREVPGLPEGDLRWSWECAGVQGEPDSPGQLRPRG